MHASGWPGRPSNKRSPVRRRQGGAASEPGRVRVGAEPDAQPGRLRHQDQPSYPRLPVSGAGGPFSVFDARASVTQTVFDFGSIRRYQASRTGIQAAGEESDAARDQVARQVALLYLAAVRAEARVQSAQADAGLAESLQKLAENQKGAGTGTGIEVTRAKVQLAQARQQLLVAQSELRQSQLELLRTIGLALDTPVRLTANLDYSPVEVLSPEKTIEAAFQTRADWKAQQKREEAARLSYSGVKLERLPSVAAFADYGSIGNSITHAIPTRTYGLSMRVPVFDGGRRDARRTESGSQYEQERIRSADLRRQIELEARLALEDLRSAEDQVKVASEGLAMVEAELEQAQRRYQAGVTSSLEVTDAQTRLARARITVSRPCSCSAVPAWISGTLRAQSGRWLTDEDENHEEANNSSHHCGGAGGCRGSVPDPPLEREE